METSKSSDDEQPWAGELSWDQGLHPAGHYCGVNVLAACSGLSFMWGLGLILPPLVDRSMKSDCKNSYHLTSLRLKGFFFLGKMMPQSSEKVLDNHSDKTKQKLGNKWSFWHRDLLFLASVLLSKWTCKVIWFWFIWSIGMQKRSPFQFSLKMFLLHLLIGCFKGS